MDRPKLVQEPASGIVSIVSPAGRKRGSTAPCSPAVDLHWIRREMERSKILVVDPAEESLFALVVFEYDTCNISPMIWFTRRKGDECVWHQKTVYPMDTNFNNHWMMMRVSDGYVVPNVILDEDVDPQLRFLESHTNETSKPWRSLEQLFLHSCSRALVSVLYDGFTGAVLHEKVPSEQMLADKLFVKVPDLPPAVYMDDRALKQLVPGLYHHTHGLVPYCTVCTPGRQELFVGLCVTASNDSLTYVQPVSMSSKKMEGLFMRDRNVNLDCDSLVVRVGQNSHCTVSFGFDDFAEMSVLAAIDRCGQQPSVCAEPSLSKCGSMTLWWDLLRKPAECLVAFQVDTPHHRYWGVLRVVPVFEDDETLPQREVTLPIVEQTCAADHRCWIVSCPIPERVDGLMALHCPCNWQRTVLNNGHATPLKGVDSYSPYATFMDKSHMFCRTMDLVVRFTSPAGTTFDAEVKECCCPFLVDQLVVVRGFCPEHHVRVVHQPVAQKGWRLRCADPAHTMTPDGTLIVRRSHPGYETITIRLDVVLDESVSDWFWPSECTVMVNFSDFIICDHPRSLHFAAASKYYSGQFPMMTLVRPDIEQYRFWRHTEKMFDAQQELYFAEGVEFTVKTMLHMTNTSSVNSILEFGFGITTTPAHGRLGGHGVYFDSLTPESVAFKLFRNKWNPATSAVLLCSVIVPKNQEVCGPATVTCEFGVGVTPCHKDSTWLYTVVFPSALATHVMLREILLYNKDDNMAEHAM